MQNRRGWQTWALLVLVVGGAVLATVLLKQHGAWGDPIGTVLTGLSTCLAFGAVLAARDTRASAEEMRRAFAFHYQPQFAAQIQVGEPLADAQPGQTPWDTTASTRVWLQTAQVRGLFGRGEYRDVRVKWIDGNGQPHAHELGQADGTRDVLLEGVVGCREEPDHQATTAVVGRISTDARALDITALEVETSLRWVLHLDEVGARLDFLKFEAGSIVGTMELEPPRR